MNYTHITQDERYQIAILGKAGHDKSSIARMMNRHKSTIGREMARNRAKRSYGSACEPVRTVPVLPPKPG